MKEFLLNSYCSGVRIPPIKFIKFGVNMKNKTALFSSSLMAIFLFPAIASAHIGVGPTTGFSAGIYHPLSGLDHLLAMTAVGLWASYLGGRAKYTVPCAFVGMMVVGGILGISGVPIPYVETGIILSVIVLGALIAGSFKTSETAGILLVGAFAIMHGHAHGSEMPLAAGAISYSLGFILSTVCLHATGIILGSICQKANQIKLYRLAGVGIMLAGLYMAIASA